MVNNELEFLACACKFTETNTEVDKDDKSASKRLEIKNLIAKLKEINPYVESNIFKSVENVNLHTIISYKQFGESHSYKEWYDDYKRKWGNEKDL